jgi:anti-sigma factor RsiW
MESACKSYQMLLSAYADGEVSAAERAQVELHLSGCSDCRARLADLQALSAAVAARLEQQADEADFAGFADAVMRRIGPERPGIFERMRVGWSEILAYHRTAVISSLATAAVTLLVAVPVAWKLASSNSPAPEVVLQDLRLEDPNVQPVVMKMGDGRTLIMLVHRPGPSAGEAAPLEFNTQPPTGGDL